MSPGGPGSEPELELARSELAALEGALEALPQVFEDKFRQQLLALQQINHHLQREQASLRSQLLAAQRPMTSPRRRRLWVVLACLGLAGLGWGAARLPLPRTPAVAPGPVVPLSSSILVVQAQGSSWVEVQDLRSHAVLFIGTLEAGQGRSIRLRRGLRLRSGRPDLLTLRINDGQSRPFGVSQGQDWLTVLPPEFKRAGA